MVGLLGKFWDDILDQPRTEESLKHGNQLQIPDELHISRKILLSKNKTPNPSLASHQSAQVAASSTTPVWKDMVKDFLLRMEKSAAKTPSFGDLMEVCSC